ncbi:hypothetical protein IQ254_15210 [Nodosilinea sp. LEGE 07088]|uniref:hypothetical protein n=1 Tax=Nodosilinea sp. LEGE 07088 TaxID=2777968 RepID=UPI00187FD821|nr:hypothetical protein [Nodosilinea sp. LEGE 07088]MBE9138522.1 hypothetical protein [Nodosilinea sp. LEGE 07088]
MTACFWVVMGLMGYIRGRYFWSAIAFILAISTRQYMLAFPAAVATYEFIVALMGARQTGRIVWQDQWRWIAPLMAACSIFVWFYLFQGMVPQSGFEARGTPEVQQTTWGLDPGVAVCFLAFVGLYIVIPEFLLFQPLTKLRSLRQQWPQQTYRVAAIALGLLIFILVFPPPTYGAGNLVKLAKVMPHEVLRIGLYYSLALPACLRFIRPNLIGLIILFNTLIMMKAYPWDRYVLPLAVAFWYLKSEGVVDWFPIFSRQPEMDDKPGELSTAESS